jgi:hypothetical protein
MNVYKTPAGVKIGLLYRPPMPDMDSDALALQVAILEQRSTKRPFLMRLFWSVWKWL